MTASSVDLHNKGILQQREQQAHRMLSWCVLCPRRCKVDRLAGETGECKTGRLARIASFGPHFGEEGPLVGSHGSGAIFLSSCSLRCCFCQNHDISQQEGVGEEVDAQGFASIMLELQGQGCHNINLVTPSHVVPQIISALVLAVEGGLNIPVIYNSSGYDSLQSLELLHGVVDIYMPDFKFWAPESAFRYAEAKDYPERARSALLSMHNQVGELLLDGNGVAVSGLLIRHLMMPGLASETEQILTFIANSLSKNSYVNIMDQYHPFGTCHHFPEIDRSLSPAEYKIGLEFAKQVGLTRIDRRDVADIWRCLKQL
ncbi:MAG: radical SAM protein [Desulfobulbaceae bacterium]|nr:radical SAM protein [Desulfobulbaceae bacterium]